MINFIFTIIFTIQGWTRPSVDTMASSFLDSVRDYFENTPIGLLRFEALALGASKGVFEIVARNNLNFSQNLSWHLSTGYENISSGEFVNFTADDVYVLVEASYPDGGVYRTNASVNSSSYVDSQSGVVII